MRVRIALSMLATLVATAAAPALAALPVGAAAPDFTTQAAVGGKEFSFALATALKKGPVVLYFFPAAFSKGCTIEAHAFAEAAAEFKKNGATLIGLSADPIDKLAKFSVQDCRNKFPVGVAAPNMVSGYDVLFGAGKSFTNRTSYVIAPNGKIIYALNAMEPLGHVSGTLDAVKKYKAARRRG